MQHVIVFARRGCFAGWPANHGLWTWDGAEIMVGFAVGGYRVSSGHNIVKPYRNLLARSLDGGARNLDAGYGPRDEPLRDGVEDPVTGVAHCCLGPFWRERLDKTDLLG